MTEIIGLITFLLCVVTVLAFILKDIVAKKNVRDKNDKQSLEKQEEVETRIGKIENVYGEKAIVIMFQELKLPNICELLVILEEARIILIFGEAYNFSEILNFKIGQSDYTQLKYTNKVSLSTSIIEKTAAGFFSTYKIKDALKLLEEVQEPVTTTAIINDNTDLKIMTSRLEEPMISISPSCHSIDEVILALSIIIDRNENKRKPIEIPRKC